MKRRLIWSNCGIKVESHNYEPWQKSQNTGQNSDKPELDGAHGVLENPERVLEAEAGDAEAVVEQREQEVEEHGQEDRGPVDDGLKENGT